MDSANWKKLKDSFNQAIDMPLDKRADFLKNFDEDFRTQLKNLIEAHENAEDFIVEPAMVEVGLSEENETDFYVGKQIDDYKILKEIGHGGMGTVYLAERIDESFSQIVAIKLIKRGMDTNSVLKRFMMERQILSRLEHPHIARLLDGGSTADGLPYFVMEFIEGLPINKFCDAHRFSIEERLELFRNVCSAVSFAHQNLVVHRDLKPSNIIVTNDGTPKLLDFGIAKLLNPDWSVATTEATATIFHAMTPEYASPEQIRGLPINTTSDVYSLGVVLYELLTGQRPFKIESRLPEEIARIILTEEPLKPSDAVTRRRGDAETNPPSAIQNPKSLRGDLDNIILKALRKEPARRYGSVQEFSEDIRRHLVGLPVSATSDTVSYRLRKFVNRHRVGVFASFFIALTLLSATIITTWQSIAAQREREKAERRFNDVRYLSNSLMFEFHDSIKDLEGATGARELLVKKALEYLNILAREDASDASLQFELAVAYTKVGAIQGYDSTSGLGDTAGAIESYQTSINLLENLLKTDPQNKAYQSQLAAAYMAISKNFEITGDVEGVLKNNEQASLILTELINRDETDIKSKMDLAVYFKGIGDVVSSRGDLEKSLENYRKTLAISNAVLQTQPTDVTAKKMQMVAYDAIGTTLGNPNFTNLGDSEGALEAYRRQLEICNGLLETDQTSLSLRANKAFTLKVIGEVLTAENKWKEALESYKQALEIQEPIVRSDEKNTLTKARLAYMLSNMGETLAKTKHAELALEYHGRAVEILTKLAASDSENSALLTFLNRSYQLKADALVETGRLTESFEFYHKALASNEEMAKQDLNNMDIRLALASDYAKTGKANFIAAMNSGTSPIKKIEFVREARKRFVQSRETYTEMQSHNLKTKPIATAINNLDTEIAKCDEVLKLKVKS